jgi:hypothetical protein
MIVQPSILLALLTLVDRLPLPPRGRSHGRPPVYPDRLFLKALVVMVVRHVPTVHALLALVEQPTAEMQQVRQRLTADGRFPSRRTWERRLAALPERRPAQIACLGQHLVGMLAPWSSGGRAAAIDSTALRAKGGVWHKKDREVGIVPHSSIDVEAHWTRSGWHGWVYGWKLHLVTTVAAVWLPLAARLTPANAADNEVAPALIAELPPDPRFLLGDVAYDDADLQRRCDAAGRVLVTARRGRYPHTDDGVEVRRIFHELRSRAIENFNGQFKAIFDVQRPVPTKGLRATRRFVLGAVLVYQLTLWLRADLGLDLRQGLKPFLQAA